MEKQYSPGKKEKKLNQKEKIVEKTVKEAVPEIKKEEKVPTEQKKEEKKEYKKEVASVRGVSLSISPKNAKYICKMILRKTPEKGIEMLEEVLAKRRAVPMNGAEIPHRKGMMSGRYPFNASKEIIVLLKQLKANSNVNGIENPIVTLAMANKASLPYRREGRKGKRAHVYLEAREKTKLMIKKK